VTDERTLVLQMITVGFAAWRISSMLVNEEGPWNLFGKIRRLVGIGVTENGIEYHNGGMLASLFSCVWCFSVWASPALWIVYLFAPAIVFVFASMTIAIMIDRFVKWQS